MSRRQNHRSKRHAFSVVTGFRGLHIERGPLAQMAVRVAWLRTVLAAAATVLGLTLPGRLDRFSYAILTGAVALPYSLVALAATRRSAVHAVSPVTLAGDCLIVFVAQWGFPELRATGAVAYMLLVAIYTPIAGLTGGLVVAGLGIAFSVAAHMLNPDSAFHLLALGLFAVLMFGLVVVIASATGEAREQIRRRVSVVSHEIRGPMTSIAGFAGTLVDRWAVIPEADRREFIERIRRNAVSIKNIIEMLLESSEIERGRVRVRAEEFDLAEHVHELCESCSPILGERTVEIAIATGVVVRADPFLLDRVLMNLVLNAHGYSPTGTALRLVADRRDAEVVVSVMDRGAGIPVGVEERIFESFWRPGDQSHSGTGIGLGLVRDLLACMGGRVWVEARPGGGSAFVFTLPLASATTLRPAG